jgi:4'-phosphopantetheinyl transferase
MLEYRGDLEDMDLDKSDASRIWAFPPAVLSLESNEVHLWRVFPDLLKDGPESEGDILSPDEMERASRFVFERDRNRFVAVRRALRTVLGQYLHKAAAKINFIYDRQGKPRLQPNDCAPPIRFNLSHSYQVAVIAVSLDREIGVDVELVRSDIPIDKIAEMFFSPREFAEYRDLATDQRRECFFRWWSLKEAYLKALGAGLLIPLESFDVSFTPGRSSKLYSNDYERWSIQSFQPHPAYTGAIVVEGNNFELNLWDHFGCLDLSDK